MLDVKMHWLGKTHSFLDAVRETRGARAWAYRQEQPQRPESLRQVQFWLGQNKWKFPLSLQVLKHRLSSEGNCARR